jgi:plastocyanin
MAQDPSTVPSMVPMPSAIASVPPGASPAVAIPVTLADFTVTPADLVVSGTTVSFDVVNDGPTPHNLAIRDAAGTLLGTTPDLSQGERATLTLTLPGPGDYVTFCSLPGHESLGLKGTLTVSDALTVDPSPPASAVP